MTSNLASPELAQLADQPAQQATAVQRVLRQTFRPEFLNRIDDTIIFQPLSQQHSSQIVELQLGFLQQRLAAKGIQLQWSQPVVAHLVQVGFDEAFGARPLKRALQNELVDELSLQILEGKISSPMTVEVGLRQGKIFFTARSPKS
jgi:ATP-dependent Clp protease ATP-binding subunit ClpB